MKLRNFFSFVSIALVGLTLTACGGPHWAQRGMSPSDASRDQYACTKDAAAVQDKTRASQMTTQCMRAKGWLWVS